MRIFNWSFRKKKDVKPQKIYTKNGREGINQKSLNFVGLIAHYNNKLYSGTAFEITIEDEVQSETIYVNGLREGIKKIYDIEDGELIGEVTYKNNKLQGGEYVGYKYGDEKIKEPKKKTKINSDKVVKVSIGNSVLDIDFNKFKSLYDPKDHICDTNDEIDYEINPYGNPIENIDLESLDPDGEFFSCAKIYFDGGYILAFYFKNCKLPDDLEKKYDGNDVGCDIYYKDGKPLDKDESKIFSEDESLEETEEISAEGWVLYRFNEVNIYEFIKSGDN